MDTTSLSFEGAGGAALGAHGHSKDHRPDLNQMIVGVMIDGEGRPVCSEMLPGNTADVSVLISVIDRLRQGMTAFSCCAPMPGSRRCRHGDIATSSRWRSCSAQQRR
jgi:transposase